jgi:CheY-like chemotaxis protein
MNCAKPIILIAEDDQDTMQNMLKGLLSKRRLMYDALVCVDGLEALEIIETHRVDCLILDLDMGNLNGIETLQELKTRGRLKGITVIVSSGHIDESMVMQLESLGVGYYLKKPYPLSALLEQVDRALTASHAG